MGNYRGSLRHNRDMRLQQVEDEESSVYRFAAESGEMAATTALSETSETMDSMVWDNPLLAKELRAGRRGTAWIDARTQLMRRARKAVLYGSIGGGVFLTLLYAKLLPSLAPREIEVTWRILLGIITAVQAAVLASGAGGISGNILRERSKQTWSALLLTRLTPRQMVLGKTLGGLASGALGALALLPVALWCLANAGPAAWLWTPLAWLIMLVAAPLTALLALRPALQGNKISAGRANAAGALWLGGPLLVQMLYTIGVVIALALSQFGPLPDGLSAVFLVLGIILGVPLLLTSPLVVLILTLPWFWPDLETSNWALFLRLLAIVVHLVFTSVLLRRAWHTVLKEAPKSAPDLG
jgi:ABC-type multidrug transport system permease subunit